MAISPMPALTTVALATVALTTVGLTVAKPATVDRMMAGLMTVEMAMVEKTTVR